MLLHVKTNGATDLIVNIHSKNVEYIQQMVDLFENNVVAVRDGGYYSESNIVEMDASIQLGDKVVFAENRDETPKLIVCASKSEELVREYDPQPLESYLSYKKALQSANERNNSLSKEIAFLKDKVSSLESQTLDPEVDPEGI